MERELESSLDNIMSKPNVVGVVCADKHGLCLSAKGVARAEMAGVICYIADQARKIEPSSSVNPTIRLESESQQGYCLVQKRSEFTLGIFKKY